MSRFDGWAYDNTGQKVYVGPAPDFITDPPYGYTWEKQTGGAFNEVPPATTTPVWDMGQGKNPQRVQDEFAEASPSAYYSSVIANLDKPQKDYFTYKYQDVYNEYLADVAKNLSSGIPTGKFNDFLSKYNFNQTYMKQPYINRGGYQSRQLAPSTRFINY